MATQHRILSLLLLSALFLFGYSATPADSILGKWQLVEGTAVFDFYKIGDEYRARQLGILYPVRVTIVAGCNPNPYLRIISKKFLD
jgi:hypothetical protein